MSRLYGNNESKVRAGVKGSKVVSDDPDPII